MSVDVRVGNYKLDSSNFISAEGFRGFLGSTGTVGIDRDYDSLRQDIWLATDQAYKEALDSLSKSSASLRSLANAPTIDDFSQEPPVVMVEPRVEPDWTSRNWEAEAKAVSAVLKNYPELYNSRVTYHLIYATTLSGYDRRHADPHQPQPCRHRGQPGRASGRRHAGAQLSGRSTSNRPGELPAAEAVRQQLDAQGSELVALRAAPPVQDYDGPMLFEAPRRRLAAGADCWRRRWAGRGRRCR